MPDIRFRDLRHTYTTILLSNNYNMKAVSELLGHASSIITVKTYFDKEKVVINCNEELESYIERVKPKELEQITILDINLNKIVNNYL